MIPIYRAGWQLFKVRAVSASSLIALPVAVYFGIYEIRTYGLSDYPELAMGVVLILLGVAFAVGMWLYGRQYAARIGFDAAKKQLHLETVNLLWNNHHVIDIADVGRIQYHQDIKWINTPGVYAPWTSVRIKGWRWPLIIDQQGQMLQPELLQSLLGVFCPDTTGDDAR
jgi:hypothetical protein